MRKTWTTLVVLGILLCMFVSIGANAQAAEDALTILAVNGDVLTDEQIAALKNEYSNGYILDVSGKGTNSALDIVFSESHPVDVGGIVPESGEHKTEILYLGDPMTLEANGEKITLIGVNAELDAGTIGMLLEGAEGKIVAVGKAEAGQAVKDAGIGLFLTTDASDGVQTMVTANVGVTQVVNVGGDSANPVTKVTLDWEGNLQAEPMAPGGSTAMIEPGPVVDEPVQDQPAPEQPAEEQSAPEQVFNVWYDRNGAEGGVVYDTQVSESNPLILPENGYTHEGYTFAGWNYNGTIYQPGDSLYLSGDTTIYAAWDQAIQVYDVTFDANGAESGSMEGTQVTAGNAFELPANGYAREGYEFTGWDVNGAVYQPYETASINGDTTVYAQWQAVSAAPTVYNIWFDANGAEAGSMEATQVTEGNAFELPENGYTYTGYNFTGWNVNGSLYQPHEFVTITGDTTIYAAWEQAPAEAPTYTLTYEPGEGTGEAYTAAGTQLTLDACPFTAPEGKHFVSWSINGAPYDAGAVFELTADAAAVATYEANEDTAATPQAQDPGLQNGSDMRTWKHGGTDAMSITFANAKVDTVAVGPADAMTQTLDASSYTVEDYNTTGCTVTLTKAYLDTLTVGNTYKMDFTFKASADGATYEPVSLQLHINAADVQDAGIQNGTDMRTWKQGGTDKLAISFANAKVATVTVSPEGGYGATLTAGSQFTVSNFGDNGQTVTFVNTYLDSLAANTTYNVDFTFADANGFSYAPISVKLHVTPADPVTTPEQNRKETWNRAYELPLTFEGRTPSGLQIRFGADNWVSGTNNTDYRLNGSTITLLPAMVNGGSRWQSWGNGGYTFRVTFTSGDPVEVSVTLEGTAPTNQTQPTATPVPGSTATPNLGPTAPVTGDETPIVLYVVILVLLVAALAIVIILLTKKNRGRR